MEKTTYNVRVYKNEVYKGAHVTAYRVRWKVGGEIWRETFRNSAQADSFRSELVTAARKGEAFAVETGRPVSWGGPETEQDKPELSWYEFACSYAEMKWQYSSPNHRRGIAEALTDATEALVSADDPAMPSTDELRRALREWAFSGRIRAEQAEPPPDLAPAVKWLTENTVSLAALTDTDGAALARSVLDRISRKRDGSRAAANTANRKRMVLGNAMAYACEVGALPINPFSRVKWTKPRTLRTVDPRTVINVGQARRFLAAVRKQGEWGERLQAFFGSMYYGALRPEEAIDLTRDNLRSLPRTGWGEMLLTSSEPRSGGRWTESGKSRERQALKHRAPGDTRPVPVHPDLVALFVRYIEQFSIPASGRLFVGPRGGIVSEHVYLAVFHDARRAALTEAEIAAGVMDVPYALRHAAVSTWLNAGVPATQVAEWAGHSVDVLLRVYAKCVAGQQDEAKRRIDEATRPPDDGAEGTPTK